MRYPLTAVLIVLGVGCRGDVPTSPTPLGNPPNLQSTFTLSGVVHDITGRPVAGAELQVTEGFHIGARTVADKDGVFEFTQTFTDDVFVRASKADYIAGTRHYRAQDGRARRGLSFGLEPAAPDIYGTYLLTFTAADACTSLPQEARSRTYSARLIGAPSEVVTLTGADFAPPLENYPWNVLYVSHSDGVLRISFGEPPIVERLASHSTVVISANVTGPATGSTTRMPADGRFAYCPTAYGGGDSLCAGEKISCQSANHTLTLTRQ